MRRRYCWRPSWPGQKPSYGYDLVANVIEPMLGVTLTREQADASRRASALRS